jgi:hypothetical protein
MANGGDKTAAEVQALVDALKEQLIVERELGEEGLKMFDELQKQKDLLQEMLKDQEERIKNGEAITEGEIKLLKTQMKSVELEEKRIDQIKKGRDALKDLGGEFDNVLSKVTGIGTGWKTGVLGGIDKAIEEGRTMGDVFKEFGSSIARTFSLKNLAMTFVGNFIQQTTLAIMSVDQARADFVKAAGTTLTGDQTAMLTDLADAQNKFGQTIESTTKNYGVLMQTVSGFRNLSQSTQKEVLAAAGQFEALGIAAEDTGQFINFATKAMGMSETEAVGMQTRLVALSREVSASGTQLMQQMQQMEGDLAQFGSNMEQEFANLAKTADKTGASMQDLVSIAKQFDTFKGAAQAVGKLNTLIGANVLNMKEMVGLSFDERVKMLSKRAEQAGVSFETMGRQRKLAFAAALGTDVATMMKVMTGAADAQKAKLDELNLSQEDMNELAEKATPVMLMLKASFQKFIIALEPVIMVVRNIIEEFANLDKEMIQLIGGVLIGLFVISKLTGIFSVFSSILTPIASALPLIGAGGKTAAGGIYSMGLAAGTTAKGLLVLTGLVLAVGAAFTGTILALAYLVKTMDQAKAPFTEIAVGLMGIAGAMAALLLTFKFAALTFPVVIAGAVALALSLGALALALAFIKTEDLQAIATIFGSVAKAANPFDNWTAGLTTFVKALDDIDVEKLEKLDKITAPVAKITTAIGEIDNSNIEAIQEAKGLLTELRLTAEQGGVLAVASALNALSSAFNTKQKVPPIQVKVGEKVILDIVEKDRKRSMNPTGRGALASIAGKG